ncbi:hypothetical protein ADK43_11585, partial [Streptomyces rimosus subsp. rimosus]
MTYLATATFLGTEVTALGTKEPGRHLPVSRRIGTGPVGRRPRTGSASLRSTSTGARARAHTGTNRPLLQLRPITLALSHLLHALPQLRRSLVASVLGPHPWSGPRPRGPLHLRTAARRRRRTPPAPPPPPPHPYNASGPRSPVRTRTASSTGTLHTFP